MKCLLFLKSSIVIHYYTLITNDSRLRPMFLIKYIFVLFKYWMKSLMRFVSFWTYLAPCPNREMSFPPTIQHIHTYMSDPPPRQKQILWWNNFCINLILLLFREVSYFISLLLIYIPFSFFNIQWPDLFNKHFLISWGLILSGLYGYRKEK